MKKSSPEDSIQEPSMSNTSLEPLAPIDITMKWEKLIFLLMNNLIAIKYIQNILRNSTIINIWSRLDSLENPVKPPIVIYKHTDHWDALKKGLEPADQQIVDRLQKLKEKERNISVPTIDEIRQRLALLKDQDPQASGSNVINICINSVLYKVI